MAAPDRMRNKRVLPLTSRNWSTEPAASAMPHEKTSMTTVRTAVATVEFVLLIPHFARIDVTPAKKAEPTA